MYNCTVEDCTLTCIYYAVSTLSVVMCMVAIGVLKYYKFYRSFNYRLVLYLLISFLIKAPIAMTVYTSLILPDSVFSSYDAIVLFFIANSLFWYSLWNIQLCIAFMTAEIFSMVIFSVELRKAEIPLTIACFTLPLVELVGTYCYIEKMENYTIYNAILGVVVTGICAIATAITLICLAYHGLRRHSVSNNNEEQHLLHQHTRRRYRNALKESLPLIIYPAMMLLWLLGYYIFIFKFTIKLLKELNVLDASTGIISSIVFFILIKILGQYRRNVFRQRAYNVAPSNSNQEINEGQRITVAGSITATHVTDFDPLGDSDVEP